MRLTSLALKDFGAHKEVFYDLDAAVVGIVGKNGRGKSTVLKALRYGMTGQTGGPEDTDAIATFIRNTGNPPPKSASAVLTFRKDGAVGTIERKIKKTSTSRTLTWDGVPHTKADAVDTIMADMLGASRRAIGNTVFIPQGQLDKILFGSQAEKEALFIRLLLLDHLEDVAKQLDKHTAILAGGLQDHTIALDEIMAQRRTVEENLQSAIERLASSVDWTDSIQLLINIDNATKALEEIPAQIASVKSAGVSADEKLKEAVQVKDLLTAEIAEEFPGLSSGIYEDMEVSILELHRQRDNLQRLIEWTAKEEHARKVLETQKDLGRTYDQDVTRLARAVAPADPQDTMQIAQLQKDLRGASNKSFLRSQVSRLAGELHQAMELKGIADNALNEHRASWEGQRNVITMLAEQGEASYNHLLDKIGLHKAVLQHLHNEQGLAACPLCAQPLSGVPRISAESLAALETEAATLKSNFQAFAAQKFAAENKLQTLQNASQAASVSTLNAQRNLDAKKTEYDSVVLPDGFDVEASSLALNDLQGKEAARKLNETLHREAVQRSATQAAAAETAAAQVKAVEKERPGNTEANLISAECRQGYSLRLSQAITALQPRMVAIRAAMNSVDVAHREVVRLESVFSASSKLLEALQQKRAANAPLDAAAKHAETEGLNPVEVLRERQAAHQALVGERRSLGQQAEGLIARQQDIEKKIEENAVRQMTVSELKQLKDLFARSGLPMLYCRQAFTRLAALTAQNLATMESNFIVAVDEEVPLNFKFLRVDEEESAWLPQSKLSGGQRVRLTIAFLLAVQRIVIPDVGLLVLDEPTTHLDEEAVEALVSLLQEMGNKLSTAEIQVIVCDHHPMMRQAFQKTIQL